MTTLRQRLILALQIFTAALALVAGAGLIVSAGCVLICVDMLRRQEPGGVMLLLLCLGAATACVCCIVALGLFFRLCGRMKEKTAFTAVNCTALRRISCCCFIASAAMIPALIAAMTQAHTMPLWISACTALLAFALVTIGLMIRTVYLLMLRAEKMQQDADLTI